MKFLVGDRCNVTLGGGRSILLSYGCMCKAYYTTLLCFSQGEIIMSSVVPECMGNPAISSEIKCEFIKKTSLVQDDYCNPASFPVQ